MGFKFAICADSQIATIPRVKIRSRLLTKIIAVFGVALVRLLFKTCRLRTVAEVPGRQSRTRSTGDNRYLYCVWHDQIVMTVFSGRPQNMAGLVSGHQDGSYLADAMKTVGIAARPRLVKAGWQPGDGRALAAGPRIPRGDHARRAPRTSPQVENGDCLPRVAFGSGDHSSAYACRRAWRIRGNWTDMMLPWPFTRFTPAAVRRSSFPPVSTVRNSISTPSGWSGNGVDFKPSSTTRHRLDARLLQPRRRPIRSRKHGLPPKANPSQMERSAAKTVRKCGTFNASPQCSQHERNPHCRVLSAAISFAPHGRPG